MPSTLLEENPPQLNQAPSSGLIALLAVSIGCIVANIYYAQPLLAEMAKSFGIGVAQIGGVAMLSQIGTALGMLVFVPLGDTHERRGLICNLLIAASVFLALTGFAQNTIWLALAAFSVGVVASTVHIIVPLAAHLAPEGQRGRIVGTVFSGMLMGILLARTFSGMLGAYFGWRAVYWLASALMLALAALLRARLPVSRPDLSLPWTALLRSVAALVREHPQLRESAAIGALFFCAFSAFWTTLVFLLSTPPFHYGSFVAGLFGLIGAAGAAVAPLTGRLADKRGPRWVVLMAILTTIAAYLILAVSGHNLIGLVIGVALMDLGVQSGHISNQTRIYSLVPEARSRLNTAYMVSYFIGGALGSYCGAVCWKYWGWLGVCGFAIAVLLAALTIAIRAGARERFRRTI